MRFGSWGTVLIHQIMHKNNFKELFQNLTIKLQLLWSIIYPFLKIENKTEMYFNRIMNALLLVPTFKEKSQENFL